MITYDYKKHAENIEKINARNDAADEAEALRLRHEAEQLVDVGTAGEIAAAIARIVQGA